jgi:uncharacterized membrane protein HdeD (DUF308 family)
MSTRQRAATASFPWWLFLVTGIAWLLISLIVLRFNITSVASVGVLLGVVLIMAGANEFVDMSVRGSWKWLHAILGVLFIGGGIWAFVHPIGAFYELASILGFLLLLKGSLDITVAVATREINDLWWMGLVVGILEILLAFWASQQFFAPRAALILLWVGFAAMFRGFTEIFLAFEVRRLSHEVASV